jgi:hypothetical protein
MNLYQLVYSSARTPRCTDEEILNILDSCKRNNPSRDITGVLLHTDNHFIQYLEGDKDIIKLYDMIRNDPRHSRVVMLSYGPIRERIFPSWHMGYKTMSRDEITFHTDSSMEDRRTFQSILKGENVSDANAVKLLVKFFQKK